MTVMMPKICEYKSVLFLLGSHSPATSYYLKIHAHSNSKRESATSSSSIHISDDDISAIMTSLQILLDDSAADKAVAEAEDAHQAPAIEPTQKVSLTADLGVIDEIFNPSLPLVVVRPKDPGALGHGFTILILFECS